MSIETVFDIVERLLTAAPNSASVEEDSASVLLVRLTEASVESTAAIAIQARAEGAIVEMEVRPTGAPISIPLTGTEWSIPRELLTHVPGLAPYKGLYSTEELASNLPAATFYFTFNKQPWGPPWIGRSGEAFTAWLDSTGYWSAGEALLSTGPGRVALSDWRSGALMLDGGLTVGDLTVSAVPSELPRWPEDAPEWCLRAAQIVVAGHTALPSTLMGLAYAAAVRLLAEAVEHNPDGTYRVLIDASRGRKLTIPARQMVPAASGAEVQSLVRWVLAEPLQTRLTVARRVIAEQWKDGDFPSAPDPLLPYATLTYNAAVDERVAEALAAQSAFEEHVNEFSDKLAEALKSTDKAIDEVITRAMAAVLTLFVAAVVAKALRGWPVILAAMPVALYIAWVGRSTLAGMKGDIERRRKLTNDSIAGRPEGWVESVRMEINDTSSKAERRITLRQWTLYGLASFVLIFSIGLAGYIERPQEQSNGTPTATPTSTIIPVSDGASTVTPASASPTTLPTMPPSSP